MCIANIFDTAAGWLFNIKLFVLKKKGWVVNIVREKFLKRRICMFFCKFVSIVVKLIIGV